MILLVGGVLLLIDSFLAWNKWTDSGVTVQSQNAWLGVGVLMGILTIALVAWEVLLLLEVKLGGLLDKTAVISAGLAALVALFAVIRSLGKVKIAFGAVTLDRAWPATAGIILAAVLALGAVIRLTERRGQLPERDTAPPAA
jgi:hypothetical protein